MQKSQKTFSAKPGEVERRWYLVDLEGLALGRAATRIAMVLRGKHKAEFTPHVDTGDFVVVVNAAKVKLTGRKLDQKRYYRHSGYLGNLKIRTARQMLAQNPEELVRLAVRGMLPKNSLGRKQLKKLKVFAGSEHRHEAQKPVPLDLETIR